MARRPATADRVEALIEALGRLPTVATRAYVVGGTSAVLEGWRDTTKDVDLVFEPESRELYEGIARLKESLEINVELAAPSHFVPEVPGWRERSRWIESSGKLHVYHYDPVSQVLAKLERGHDRDRLDVAAMLDRGWVDEAAVRAGFAAIVGELVRYPALDRATFEQKLEAYFRERSGSESSGG